MPGLSQLKQFNKDILALGDETSLRASRGEHPVRVPIPKTIKDINDSNDFVLGMPENEILVEDTPVDDDLSDILNPNANSGNGSNSGNNEATQDGAVDLSSLLNPLGDLGDGGEGGDMPDLSAFMDEPVADEPVVEEPESEPEPVSIADMGLEALLSGTGFDGSDINELEDTGYVSKVNSDEFYTDEELENIAPPEKISKNEKHVGSLNIDDFDELPGFNNSNSDAQNSTPLSSAEQQILSELNIPGLDLSDLGVENTEEVPEELTEEVEDAQDITSQLFSADDIEMPSETSDAIDVTEDFGLDDFNLDAFAADSENDATDVINEPAETGDAIDDFVMDEPVVSDDFEIEEPAPTEDFGFNDLNTIGDTENSPLDFGKIDISVFPDSDPTHVAEPLNDFDYPDENAEYEQPPVPKASDELEDILGNIEEMETQPEKKSEFDDLDLDNIEDLGIDLDAKDDSAEEQTSDTDELLDGLEELTDNIDDLEVYDMDTDSVPLEAVENENPIEAGLDEFDTLEDLAEPVDDLSENIESLDDLGNLDSLDSLDELTEDVPSLDDMDISSDSTEDFGSTDGLDDFNLDDIGGLDNLSSEPSSDLDLDNLGDIGETADLGDLGDLGDIGDATDLGDLDNLGDIGAVEDIGGDAALTSDLDLNLDDMDLSGTLDSIDSVDSLDSTGDELELLQGFGDDEVSETESAADTVDTDELETNEFDTNEIDVSDFDTDGMDAPDFSEEIPENTGDSSSDLFDDFDPSELDGLDFSTSTTEDDSDSSFELGSSDDFALEGSDFEIAGYTDVDIAKEEKKAPVSVLPTPDFSGAMEGSKLPPNTLSDEQYRQFTENLRQYPLNVRLAFEDFIVRDEFTDDAEFEIIEKIINKVPARQLASTLEKMLDISLPVPRDFEHRTADEYEAYKKSLEYQLRNKIIPGALVAVLCLLVGFGIFQFAKNCIYYPAKATSLYKQGYALLEADEYPQSEIKFNEAIDYKINKKWFFNYARGYRQHKQYQRSEDMYEKILRYFKHDKTAGLEYANMELQDIGNYPKAEEIVRRQVLDWHVNDADGILTLGDTFLEWGTEKDPSKFESARQQYATLINLYGAKPLYLSRMMRYFVRTDNLQQVLQLKSSFDANKKYKYDSDDVTELSGYLLDKLYGPVTPAEEYLKHRIEGVRGLLLTAVKTNPDNPAAWYNLSRYYINTRETVSIERALQRTIQEFNEADKLRVRDIYNYIDAYRLLGEYYVDKEDYLKAQEQYTEGLSLYTTERDNAGFAGTEKIGHLYSDLADINYFVSSEYKQALSNYEHAVDLNFDNPQIRYRIGYIHYRNRRYAEALSSFMKASEGNIRHKNLMLAMANTLSLRGDDYAASGYYESLIAMLDSVIDDEGIVFPQANAKHNDLVNNYLYASNNYGVTLHRLAVRTGDSALNAEAIVQFQQSVRAWDALTRNQESMVRLDGSNLALENIRYITHPFSEYEPAIYTDIKKVLTDAEGIN